MGFDTTAITGVLFTMLKGFGGVLIVVFIVAIVIVLYLKMRQGKKLVYPAQIFVDLGNGKMSIMNTKAGWFKKNTMLFGLLDKKGGNDILKVKDGREVLSGSSMDFHELNHKRGLVLYQKPDDPKILVPLTKLQISNFNLVADIAPAEYSDASVSIIRGAENEMMTKLEKWLPYIAIGVTIIGMIVTIIIVQQIFTHATDKAVQMIAEAGQNAVSMSNKGVAIASNAP